ncbi:MAG TPA: hypothetical protein VIV60_24785, partial [Polyangiaceae bacterium]
PSVPRSSFGVAASPLAPVPGPTLVLEPVDSANLVPNAPSAVAQRSMELPKSTPGSNALSGVKQERNTLPASKAPAASRPKSSKTDPYDIDNFGGRR